MVAVSVFVIENGCAGGANGCVSSDDYQELPNADDGHKEEEDDDDDDDLEGAEEIEAQKQSCMKDVETPPQNVSRFDHKQKKGFVDVWWLFDDGGKFDLILTIMIIGVQLY
jgi:Solute carrier family 12